MYEVGLGDIEEITITTIINTFSQYRYITISAHVCQIMGYIVQYFNRIEL